MKAIVLAAGEGTRLRPLTADRPKCLVEVNGRSLLDRQLAILAACDVAPVIVVGGYRSDMLKRPGVTLRLNPRYAATNMVWTLFCAEAELDETVIVSYGDIVYSRNVLRSLLQSHADIAVTIDLDWEHYWRARGENPLSDAETLRRDADGRITEIGQKPVSIDQIQGQYMGLMKFSVAGTASLKKVFHEAVKKGTLGGKPVEKAYMTDMLQTLIDSGHRVDSVPVRGGWVEVDTVSDLDLPLTRQRLLEFECLDD